MRITNTGLIYDDPSQSTPGYVLISPVRGNRAILLDPDGEVAHEWQTAGGMTHWSYLMPNGHLIANERCADPRGVMLTVSGIISEYDPQNNLMWRHIDPTSIMMQGVWIMARYTLLLVRLTRLTRRQSAVVSQVQRRMVALLVKSSVRLMKQARPSGSGPSTIWTWTDTRSTSWKSLELWPHKYVCPLTMINI